MKNKFIPDVFAYMVAPIIVCNLVNAKSMNYIIVALIFSIFIYSFIIRKRQSRLDTTGLIFAFVYIGLSLLKQGVESDFMRYIYDIYFFILSSIILIILKLFNKNIIQQIYIDALRANGYTRPYIRNSLKKSNLQDEFEKTSLVVNIHLLSMTFIKVYSIATYGVQNYLITANLQILVCMVFIVVEIYMISRIIQEHKSKIKKKENLKQNKKQTGIKVIKNIKKENKEKIIYLNKYKRTNK